MSSEMKQASKSLAAKPSPSDAEINIFDFQKEINAAEDYLRSSKTTLSAADVKGADYNTKTTLSSGAKVTKPPIEETRKKDILESFGRKPLAPKMATPSASAHLNVSSTSAASSASKYTSRIDKDKLINRLLEEHVGKTERREHLAASTGALVSSMSSDMNASGRSAAGTSFSTAPAAMQSPYRQDTEAYISSYQASDTTEDTLYFASEIPSTTVMPADEIADFNNQHFNWGVFEGTANHSNNVVFGRGGDSGVFAYNTAAGDEMDVSKMVTISNAGKRGNAYSSGAASSNLPSRGQSAAQPAPKKYLKSKDDLILEAKREFDRTFTRAPTLSSRVRRSTSLERRTSAPRSVGASAQLRQERMEKMQREHEERLKLREKQKKELENVVMLECTFKPQISKGAQSIMKSKAAAANDGDSEENKEMLLLRSQQTMRAKDAAAVLRLSGGTDGSAGTAELSKRLHDEAERRAAQQRWIEQRVTEAKMSEYTFQPTINPHTEELVAATDHRPLHERIGELQKEKSRKMQELRQNVEIENCSELTFQPRIDPKSAKLASAAVNRSASAMYASTGRDENDASSANGAAEVALLYHMSADIGSRLINEGRMQSRRKQKLMQEYELAEASLYERVRPSKGSESIARRTPSIGSLDFIERQQRFDQKLRGDVARRQQEAAAAQKELFKPAVDSRSRDIAAKARPGAANETAAEMASRLSVADAEARAQRLEAKEIELYGDIDFMPRIDKVSRAVGRATSWQELVENRKGKRARESALQKVEQMRSKNETYRPKINKTYRQAGGELSTRAVDSAAGLDTLSPFGWADCPMHAFEQLDDATGAAPRRANINMKRPEVMSKNIKQYLNEKEERRRQEMVTREIEELRDCTFAPEVQPYRPLETADPVVVRGLGRHLELKRMTEKKKADIKGREDEVFRVRRVDLYRRQEDGSTVVKPFAFNTSNKKPSRAVQEAVGQQRRELKFKPQINETRRLRGAGSS